MDITTMLNIFCCIPASRKTPAQLSEIIRSDSSAVHNPPEEISGNNNGAFIEDLFKKDLNSNTLSCGSNPDTKASLLSLRTARGFATEIDPNFNPSDCSIASTPENFIFGNYELGRLFKKDGKKYICV
jgi:hypothetical protein